MLNTMADSCVCFISFPSAKVLIMQDDLRSARKDFNNLRHLIVDKPF